MILLDLNNVMYSTFLTSIGKHTNIKIELPLIRHMVCNVIRSINTKFKPEYGQLILCSDAIRSWRKDYFPYYKAARKKNREKSELDWTGIFQAMNQIKLELQEIFPYKYIQIEGAEADDIIATLCLNNTEDSILIVSGDKDYIQLQRNDNVSQYDPINKRMIKSDNPVQYLFEHTIKGDVGDGIPNIASPDNCFVIGERQKKITKKLLEQLKGIDSMPAHTLYRNYCRNKHLIDLTNTPNDIKEKIIVNFNETKTKPKTMLLNYFSQHKLRQLTECINDF